VLAVTRNAYAELMIVDCAAYEEGRRREGELSLEQAGAAVVVELVDEVGVPLEPFRRRDILQPDALPDAAGAAESVQAGFLGDSGAGQDDDPV